MNQIRSDDFEVIFVFKSPQLRFLKTVTSFLKLETDFPDFMVCEPKDPQNPLKTTQNTKTDQTLRFRSKDGRCKRGF